MTILRLLFCCNALLLGILPVFWLNCRRKCQKLVRSVTSGGRISLLLSRLSRWPSHCRHLRIQTSPATALLKIVATWIIRLLQHMARTKQTARKRTCGYIPGRLSEAPLWFTVTGDATQLRVLRKRKRQDQEQEQLAAVAVAIEATNAAALAALQAERAREEQSGQQEEDLAQDAAEGGAGQGAAAGGDPDDGDDSNGSDSSDGAGDSEQDNNTMEDEPGEEEEDPTQEYWTKTKITRDSGNSFFHEELMKMLWRAYGRRQVGVEYDCFYHSYSTTRYPGRWEVLCKVRVSDGELEGARELSTHWSAAPRETVAAAIQDAARHAFLVYNDKHYHLIEHRRERYYPRRIPSGAGCIVASTVH
ncbi:hypothetical protein BS78_05G251100 [Paspalum vaginatum]|nr:hypothetical protein BS78_05G251100 [Paspalum vaginatum]